LSLQEFTIDTTGDMTIECLFLCQEAAKRSEVETLVALKVANTAPSLKQAVSFAQGDISTFIQNTNEQLEELTITAGVSLEGPRSSGPHTSRP
jgi:hypothetical protein